MFLLLDSWFVYALCKSLLVAPLGPATVQIEASLMTNLHRDSPLEKQCLPGLFHTFACDRLTHLAVRKLESR